PLTFFIYASGSPQNKHSFPTRRSSDLRRSRNNGSPPFRSSPRCCGCSWKSRDSVRVPPSGACSAAARPFPLSWPSDCLRASTSRSEEHTSELQSRGHLVCRLLLEKKKN